MLDPYELIPRPIEGDYIFITHFKVTYRIVLRIVKAQNVEGELYEFVFTNISDNRKQKDRRVEATISFFLIHHFATSKKPIFFICDSTDEKEAVRFRLFKRWYKKYTKMYYLDFLEIHLKTIQYNQLSSLYMALIIRKDHHKKEAIIDAFNELRIIT